MKIDSKQAVEYITAAMRADQVTMLLGSPGIGKSAIMQQIADEYQLELIDVRLSQCDPTDLMGFPFINETKDKASYIPMDMFPLESTPLPAGKEGFLLFLDEINAASIAVQAACYKLILDKKVGMHKLHPNTKIVAAGNLATDKAIVNRQSTAMQSRLLHLELEVDAKLWQEWAAGAGIDHRIIAYINHKPDDLYNFNPEHNDHTFACPRTWEFLSKIIKPIGNKDLMNFMPLLAGTISEAIARTFIVFTEIYTNMPTVREILAMPTKAKLDDDPPFRYGVSHMLAAYAEKDTLPQMMPYIERLPVEFQTITLQNVLRRKPELLSEDCVKAWITVKGQQLF